MIYRRDWRFIGIGAIVSIPLIFAVDWLNLGEIGIYVMASVVALIGTALIERDERRTGIRARIRENRRSRAQAARTR